MPAGYPLREKCQNPWGVSEFFPDGQVIVFRSIPDTFDKGTLLETPSATLFQKNVSGEAEFFALRTRLRFSKKRRTRGFVQSTFTESVGN